MLAEFMQYGSLLAGNWSSHAQLIEKTLGMYGWISSFQMGLETKEWSKQVEKLKEDVSPVRKGTDHWQL